MARVEVKGCPFCGDKPEVTTYGTCIEIMCCASMSYHKYDFLTREEYHNNDLDPERDYQYPEELEEKLWNDIVGIWNTRVQ